MGFSALSASQQVLVRLHLLGGPQYRAQMQANALATRKLAYANAGLSTSMANVTKKTFLMNQATFMARRGLFYLTMGVVAAGIAILKLGFDYTRTMQEASVALEGFVKGPQAVKKEMRELYILAAKTPFEFKDIVLATRRLFTFTEDLKTSNDLIEAVMNGLSAAGIVTGQALNRASLALAHMFAIGKLNGQVLLQLNRDNVQMTKALMWYYHATGEEVKKSVSKGLISATDAAKAFQKYMQRPGFNDAAWRQSNKTLYGAWTTFKDLISMGASGAEGGIFEAVRKKLQDINEELVPMAKAGQDITLTKVAEAINRVVSPHSNAVINFFVMFKTALKYAAIEVFIFIKAISMVLWPFNALFNLFGANRVTVRLFGVALGLVVGLLLFYKTVALLAGAANFFLEGSFIAVRIILNLLAFAIGMDTLALEANSAANVTNAAAVTANSAAVDVNTASQMSNLAFARLLAATYLSALIPALTRATIAVWEFTTALLAGEIVALPILGIAAAVLILIYALVILYFKWKWFHDLVNRTAKFVWENWKWVGWLLMATGPIGWMIAAIVTIVKYWSDIVNFMKMAYDWAKKIVDILTAPWRKTAGTIWSVIGKAAHIASYALPPGVPGSHQMGGIHAGGFAWVGEHGPELVQMPGGSRITPNAQVKPVDWSGYRAGDDRPIVVNVQVDRKTLATAVARANQDYASRR